jgi:drug/metabolite transporter (DMT)-like permease
MRLVDTISLLLLAALWGGSFLFMRIASPVLGPVWLSEFRVLIGGLVLLFLLIRLGLVAEIYHNFLLLLVLGCINAAIPFLLFAFASLSLPAGFNSILNATAPLFGTAIAFVWLKEKLTSSRAMGLALGFSGVVVLVGWKTPSVTLSFVLSIGAGLLASLMYAIAGVYTKKKLSGISPLVIATGSQLYAAILLLPAMPFTIPTTRPTTTVIVAVLTLALFSTAFANILYFRLIDTIGSTKALTVAYLIPLFAMVWGAIALAEPITDSMIWGCSLILLGTAIANNIFAKILGSNWKG